MEYKIMDKKEILDYIDSLVIEWKEDKDRALRRIGWAIWRHDFDLGLKLLALVKNGIDDLTEEERELLQKDVYHDEYIRSLQERN